MGVGFGLFRWGGRMWMGGVGSLMLLKYSEQYVAPLLGSAKRVGCWFWVIRLGWQDLDGLGR